MHEVLLHGENKIQRGDRDMSIEKKTLIKTLKTTKKANVVKDDITGATSKSPLQKSPKLINKNG
jgi:hypothetical protein